MNQHPPERREAHSKLSVSKNSKYSKVKKHKEKSRKTKHTHLVSISLWGHLIDIMLSLTLT